MKRGDFLKTFGLAAIVAPLVLKEKPKLLLVSSPTGRVEAEKAFREFMEEKQRRVRKIVEEAMERAVVDYLKYGHCEISLVKEPLCKEAILGNRAV